MLTQDQITDLQANLVAQGYLHDPYTKGTWDRTTAFAYQGWGARNNLTHEQSLHQPENLEQVPAGLLAAPSKDAQKAADAAAERERAAKLAAEAQAKAEAERKQAAADAAKKAADEALAAKAAATKKDDDADHDDADEEATDKE